MAETTHALRATGLSPAIRWMRAGQARPARVARAWLILTMLLCLDWMLLPGDAMLSSLLFVGGTPVFGGLLAAHALRLRGSTLGLVAVLTGLACTCEAFRVAAGVVSGQQPGVMSVLVPYLGLASLLIWTSYAQRGRIRRAVAILGLSIAAGAMLLFASADEQFWLLRSQARTALGRQPPAFDEADKDAMRGIAADALWDAQPALAQEAADTFEPRVRDRTNLYAVAVAAQGSQRLFAREARLALEVVAKRAGDADRGGVLLSNDRDDLLDTPLATRTNLATVLAGAGRRMDPTRDIVVVYLASHGARQAWLSTGLPDYSRLGAISSSSLRQALDRAGIRRRIVIVSACYAASWIPALATPDTIVIAAAAEDRTSFGCDDRRRLTFFGQALLEGPLARRATWQQSFEAARATVARWEAAQGITPSRPEAFVGANMRRVWEER